MLNYATQKLNMQIFNYRFRPKLIPTLVTLLVLPLLINLGLWQSNKADHKQAMQDIYDQRGESAIVQIGTEPVNLESIRFSRVVVRGYFEPAYQVLLDNQIYRGQAGYHVITPLHISGSNMRILVNRGWVPMGADRNVLPVIETPLNEVEVSGYAHDPSGKYLELAHPDDTQGNWQKVWQNLDVKRYKNAVPFSFHSILILLDPASSAGGFVRDWPKPDARIDVNRGYAIQWYLMSIALVVIYLVTNIKKIKPEEISTEDKVNAK
jgi:surfeit locus 1 family protein